MITNSCTSLHHILRDGEVFNSKNLDNNIPPNGIYVMFEKGESGHDAHRIVRIGTHNGQGQLRDRILQHYLREKKDRSIFRKNIGRCMLYKNNDQYLKTWEYDTTSKENKNKYLKYIDKNKELDLEKQISNFIHENIFFCLFEIEDKDTRLTYERKLIGTIAQCNDCCPSEFWLGKYSPVIKIKESGLWQVQGLKATILDHKDLLFLSSCLVKPQPTSNIESSSSEDTSALTDTELDRIIELFSSLPLQHQIDYYKKDNCHSDDIAYLWSRLKRAASNQANLGNATISRYALWAETIQNKIVESIALIESNNSEEAIEILKQLANSMSAFYEIQSNFDPMRVLNKIDKAE